MSSAGPRSSLNLARLFPGSVQRFPILLISTIWYCTNDASGANLDGVESQSVHRGRSVGRDDYVPAYLSLISNALSWGGSRLFLRRFGVGINEWRVLSAIVNLPGCTATQVGEELGLNKSVVSRSLHLLHSRELVTVDATDGRRVLGLTTAGHELHDQLMVIALKREEFLLAGFSPEEKALLLSFLRRMYDNVPAMNAYDPGD